MTSLRRHKLLKLNNQQWSGTVITEQQQWPGTVNLNRTEAHHQQLHKLMFPKVCPEQGSSTASMSRRVPSNREKYAILRVFQGLRDNLKGIVPIFKETLNYFLTSWLYKSWFSSSVQDTEIFFTNYIIVNKLNSNVKVLAALVDVISVGITTVYHFQVVLGAETY